MLWMEKKGLRGGGGGQDSLWLLVLLSQVLAIDVRPSTPAHGAILLRVPTTPPQRVTESLCFILLF